MQWRFFLGASLLTASLLMPHADPGAVIAGVVLAGVLQWGWSRVGGRRT
jgi:hypothetical protein